MAEDKDNPFEFLLEKVIAYRPKPGDVLVFTHPRVLPQAAHERIRASWREMTQGTPLEGLKAMILEEGMTFDVVRPADGE